MKKISLNGLWQGVCIMPDGDRIALNATVPGSSINDLINAGKLPEDIFWRDNAAKVEEFERCEYEYTHTFDAECAAGVKYTLMFHRLDTYCDVYLNDTLLGSCSNEHIPHLWDVTDMLRSDGLTEQKQGETPQQKAENGQEDAFSGLFAQGK